jgi:hypothetical protein
MLDRVSTKEDALDFLHGIRFMISQHLAGMQNRVEHLEKKKAKFDDIIAQVEQMETFDPETLKVLFKKEHEEPGSES